MSVDERDRPIGLLPWHPVSKSSPWSTPALQEVAFGLISTIVSWFPGGVQGQLLRGDIVAQVLSPTGGGTPSWNFGLAYTAVHHIAWGPRLDFTYGPLGFLTVPTLWFGITAALSFIYLVLLHLSLFALLLRFARKDLPLWAAALLSYTIGATATNMVDPGDLLMAVTFLLGVLALRQEREVYQRLTVLSLSVLASAGFLIKFIDGVLAAGVILIVVALSRPGRRFINGAIGAVAFIVTTGTLWLATGNELGDLPSFFKYSAAIGSGYSGAMQMPAPTNDWWYAAWVLLLIVGLAYLRLRGRARTEQLGSALVLAWFSWIALKEGFVRADVHVYYFFGLALVTFVVFDLGLPRLRPVALAAAAIATVITWTAFVVVPENVLSLAADTHDFGCHILTVADGQRRQSTIGHAKAKMRANYALTPRMVADLTGRTVAIEPQENAVAYAYPAMHWDPEPVLQTYSAYTASLDALDASFLRSSAAPSRILAQPLLTFSFDGRYPAFESPDTYVATLCRYVQLDASATWQVLRRVPNRCSDLRPLSSVMATAGLPVRVPRVPDGSVVTARIELSLPLTYTLAAIALKPPTMTFKAWGSSGPPTSSHSRLLGAFRFIPGTAGSLHLLRSSSTVGYSREYTPPDISSFSITGGDLGDSGHFRVRFYEMRVPAS